MKIIALAVAAVLTLGAATVSAAAADITYTGSQSANGLTADYTITTDGALGDVQAPDLVSFSVTLTNALDTFSFNQNSQGAYYQNDDTFDFTPTEIRFSNTDAPGGQLSGPSGPSGVKNGLLASSFGDELQISTAKTIQTAGTFGGTVFATAVSAAPEPSAWLLMVAGIGGIGLMLRRAKKTMDFRFKDAPSA